MQRAPILKRMDMREREGEEKAGKIHSRESKLTELKKVKRTKVRKYIAVALYYNRLSPLMQGKRRKKKNKHKRKRDKEARNDGYAFGNETEKWTFCFFITTLSAIFY